MRRTIATLAAVAAALAVPAAASAHHDYRSVTITVNNEPGSYHESLSGNYAVQATPCWQLVAIGPGQVIYTRLTEPNTGPNFGLAGVVGSLEHLHPTLDDFENDLANLRQWSHPANPATAHLLGARYGIELTIPAFGVTWDVIRWRNNSSSLTYVIRRHC